MKLAGLEQREREGQAARVGFGAVEPRDDALQVVARGELGRDHVRVRADAAVGEHAHERGERIEPLVMPICWLRIRISRATFS